MSGTALHPWPGDRPLRDWQRTAARELVDHGGSSFLVSATPAAGKTTYGLRIAHFMLSRGRVDRVVIAAPTTHICRQWAEGAASVGIDLEPNRPNREGPEPRDRHGISVTYQTIAAGPKGHARAAEKRRTLLIADEPHHMGDQAAWGTRTKAAFDRAVFRLLLSGTPFRSDNDAIPWVSYDENGLSQANFVYGYPQALVDRVCRPITFLPYDGEMEWVSDGKEWRADFDLVIPGAEAARRLRTALDAEGDWMGEVLRDADAKLSEVRMGDERAGGLVIASDQDHARAIAARLARIAGEKPEIVMSDEPGSSRKLAKFRASKKRWLVSVLMVSEGVDIPRLRVGVYATAARTELFFRQVVGRFIRATPGAGRQMSYLLLPADSRLKELAFQIEEERRHALDLSPGLAEEEELAELDELPDPEKGANGFEALSSSAELDDAILSQTTLQLFPTGDAPRPAKAKRSAATAVVEESPSGARERLRAERARLVGNLSRLTRRSHRDIQAEVNRGTGVSSVSDATREQLEEGNALLKKMIWRA